MKHSLSFLTLICCFLSFFMCGCGCINSDINEKVTSSEIPAEIYSPNIENTTNSTTVPTELSTENETNPPTESSSKKQSANSSEISTQQKIQSNSSVKISLKTYTNSVSQGGQAFAELSAYANTDYTVTVYNEKNESVESQNHTSDNDGNINWLWNVPTDLETGSYTVNVQGDSKDFSFDINIVE